jgi:hypothetical protein
MRAAAAAIAAASGADDIPRTPAAVLIAVGFIVAGVVADTHAAVDAHAGDCAGALHHETDT